VFCPNNSPLFIALPPDNISFFVKEIRCVLRGMIARYIVQCNIK